MTCLSFLTSRFRSRKPPPSQLQRPSRTQCRLLPFLVAVLTVVTVAMVVVTFPTRIEPPNKILTLEPLNLSEIIPNENTTLSQPQSQVPEKAKEIIESVEIQQPSVIPAPALALAPPPPPPHINENPVQESGPYHNWEQFATDYEEMLQNLKIFMYPDAYLKTGGGAPFANVFLPHPDPYNQKLGNYFSEHAFKLALVESSVVTDRPEEANFFFMPFSINIMRNDPRIRSATSIKDFVAGYANRISSEFGFWNASGGSDHFFVCCHSIGRDAAVKHRGLVNNAIQVTCSSSYFQRLYIPHKDIGLPQVWPRKQEKPLKLNPDPDSRKKLVFYAGRSQNSIIRQHLLASWGNDPSMDIFSGNLTYPYEEGFKRSKFCLHVKGYEVNTARISDAIHFGCIPVVISNYYDLPFANILDWSKFAVIINHEDIVSLKDILLSVSKEMYLSMYRNLDLVRRHFNWNKTPTKYDSFYMTAYQLWLRRGLH